MRPVHRQRMCILRTERRLGWGCAWKLGMWVWWVGWVSSKADRVCMRGRRSNTREIQRTLTLTHGTDRAFSAFGALGRVPSEAIVVRTGVNLCRAVTLLVAPRVAAKGRIEEESKQEFECYNLIISWRG